MTEPILFRNGPELDRRCEAIAEIIRNSRSFLPIRFREHWPQNLRPFWTLYTRKVLK